jgi:hypothetical protein
MWGSLAGHSMPMVMLCQQSAQQSLTADAEQNWCLLYYRLYVANNSIVNPTVCPVAAELLW